MLLLWDTGDEQRRGGGSEDILLIKITGGGWIWVTVWVPCFFEIFSRGLWILPSFYPLLALSTSLCFSLTCLLHPQTLLLSPSKGGVRAGEVTAGISDQWSHSSGTLSCQQGTGSGNGRPARPGHSFLLLAFRISLTPRVKCPDFNG